MNIRELYIGKKPLCFIAGFVMLLGLQVSGYSAASIDTMAKVGLNGIYAIDSDSGSGTVFSLVENPTITIYTDPDYPEYNETYEAYGTYAHAIGTDAGAIAAKVSWNAPGGPSRSLEGLVNWNQTFFAGFAGVYTWDFTIPSGMLSVGGNGSGAGVSSGYEMSIAVNGSIKWSSAATLEKIQVGDPWYYSYSYTATGNSLGGVVLGDGSYYNPYHIDYDPYNGSINLGIFNAGDAIEIAYILKAFSGGPAGETFGDAYIGDPGNLSGGGFLNGPTSQVPEPSIMILLSLGLVGVAAFRKSIK
jgi:hypothetical protein